jgi:hypothetical protein
MGRSSSWAAGFLSYTRNCSHLTELVDSLPCLQEPAIGHLWVRLIQPTCFRRFKIHFFLFSQTKPCMHLQEILLSWPVLGLVLPRHRSLCVPWPHIELLCGQDFRQYLLCITRAVLHLICTRYLLYGIPSCPFVGLLLTYVITTTMPRIRLDTCPCLLPY